MSGTFDDIIREVLQMKAPPVGAGSMFDVGMSENAPGLVVPGNINTHRREKVPMDDGGYATVRSMSFTDDDGRNVLVPTAVEGRILGDDEAIDYYRKTGQHLGIFDTPENASAYGQSLHEQQADEYK